MSKKRVYEIARILNISSKDMLNKLNELGLNVKNHMSTLEDEDVDMILDLLNEKEDKKEDKIEIAVKDTEKIAPDKNNAPYNEVIEDEYVSDDIKTKKSNKKKRKKEAEENHGATKDAIEVEDGITVKDYADLMNKKPAEVVKDLIMANHMLTINDPLDFNIASQLAQKYGIKIKSKEHIVKEEVLITNEAIIEEETDESDKLEPRPPIVTVMGHVDHGKTSLLDAIRNTNVTSQEAGGITQHIGASTIVINGKKIIFLDTPGHEAFTTMRSRGAQVTDIAILVVAADDGIMPQTVEAINHAKAAKVPIIIAINKIDKPNANVDRVKQELTEYDLVPEDWGGDTICIPISAVKKQGIDGLLEMILLVAEMQELKACKDKPAKGTVIEAMLDKGRGPAATIIVQNGTLHIGDFIVAGETFGKVKAMFDDKGKKVKKAEPSTPVEVLGFNSVPDAGDIMSVVENEKAAKQIVEKRIQLKKDKQVSNQKLTLEDLFNQIKEGKVKELNIIIKADVQGSVEALKQSLLKLSSEEVHVNIIHEGVGIITENDVILASASSAIIIGFNVRPDLKAKDMAEKEKVDVRLYRIIYDVLNDVQSALKGMLDPVYKDVELGSAEVRELFKVSGVGTIAGCYVLKGKITRTASVRLIRDGVIIFDGKLASLKRFKDDAKEVMEGFECGLMIEKYNDIREKDVIEAYTQELVK